MCVDDIPIGKNEIVGNRSGRQIPCCTQGGIFGGRR
jgi:hypothetical protein